MIRLVFILICASIAICPAQDLSGRWEGSVQIPERELPVVVDLARDSSNHWTGSIVISGLGIKGAPLTDLVISDSDASFGLNTGRGLEAAFKGRFTEPDTLTGDFAQAGNTAHFLLKKTGSSQVEKGVQMTPISQTAEGEWNGQYELSGYPRKVTVKLSNRPAGATAEFVIVGRKVNNLPVDVVRQENDLITIESNPTGISYEGRLNKSGAEINGTLTQGTIELPLSLKRSKQQ